MHWCMTCLGARCIHAVADSEIHSKCHRPIELSHLLFDVFVAARYVFEKQGTSASKVELTDLPL